MRTNGPVLSLPFLLLCAAPPAQAPDRVPGDTPGTERWHVLLRDPGYDLDRLRAAYRSRAGADAVDRCIADLEAAVVRDQRGFFAFCDARGIDVVRQWWLISGCAVDLRPEQVPALREHPRVRALHPDRTIRPGRFIQRSTNASNHGTDQVQAQGILGQGVTVAVVDSGVDADMAGSGRPHQTFFIGGNPANTQGGGIAGSRLLANVAMGSQPAEDLINHGTPVAAVAAGEVWNHPLGDQGHAPSARLVSYNVSDTVAGITTATILATTWQRIAADAARYNIQVANCSYEGYFTAQFSDQIALDQMVLTTGVVVTGMAGNGGASPALAYGATNMVAVGATEPDTRKMAAFSARGPLLGNGDRRYPDMVANGVNMTMPRIDAEAGATVSQGTSYSAPQVAGAAALYRSLRPTSSATEVKAALLASALDVSAQNLQPPYNTPNAYGTGYLHVPSLVRVAQGHGIRVDAQVSVARPTLQVAIPVVAGRRYSVALAWFRLVAQSPSWSNLDLEVALGGQPLVASTTLRTPSEHVRFTAPGTGVATLTVRGVTFGTGAGGTGGQPFSLVAVCEDGSCVLGSVAEFGAGCLRSVLRLDPTSPPPLAGASYTLLYWDNGSFVPPGVRPFLLTGVSNQTIGGVPLPIDLTPVGAPGCSLYTSSELALPIPYSSYRPMRVTVVVPLDPALVGGGFYHQGVSVGPAVNALGASTSNGVAVTIGG